MNRIKQEPGRYLSHHNDHLIYSRMMNSLRRSASSLPSPSLLLSCTSDLLGSATPEALRRTSHSDASHSNQQQQQQQLPRVAFVLGGPGTGKGTQCARAADRFSPSVGHLSAGDLLRAEIARETDEGRLVDSIIRTGRIVPSHITIGLLRKALLRSRAEGRSLVLVDGFPRNDENRGAYESLVEAPPELVVALDCPEETIRERILGRKEGRSDDNEATLRLRLATHVRESLPVMAHYEQAGVLRRLDAARPVDAVAEDFQRILAELLAKPEGRGAGGRSPGQAGSGSAREEDQRQGDGAAAAVAGSTGHSRL